MITIKTEANSIPTLESNSILCSADYLRVKSNKYGWFCDENYVMPFFIDEQLHFFRRLIITHSPIKIIDGNCTDAQYKKFLDDVFDYLDNNKQIADYVEKPQANVVISTPPNSRIKLKLIPWGTYLVDLSVGEEQLISTFHSKHRNVIRKAIKDGVTVSMATAQETHDLIADTLARQTVHAPSMQYYERLLINIPNNVAFYKAEYNGVIEGVAVIIYDDECGYYMYGGSSGHHHVGSVNYLQYEIMLDLKKKGVKYYDLVGARIVYEEGSKYEGIQRFKSRFASQLVEGYSFKYIVNPLKYKLFIACVKLYGKLHGFNYSDSIDDTLRLMAERNIKIQ